MAITEVAANAGITSKTAHNSAVNPTEIISWNQATVAGNLLVASISANVASGTPTDPTPPSGWTLIDKNINTAQCVWLYYIDPSTSTSRSGSETWTLNGTFFDVVSILSEYTGAPNNCLDVHTHAGSATSTSPASTGTTGAIAQAVELIIGATCNSNTTTETSPALGGSFTGTLTGGTFLAHLSSANATAARNTQAYMWEAFSSATGTAEVHATLGTTRPYSGAIAAFKGTATGITGSGGITAVAASLAATGREDFKATGGLGAAAAAFAGTSHEDFRSSGGIAASAASLSGTGREDFKGSGGFAASPAALAGTSHEDEEASGGIAAAAASFAGTGHERFVATGGILGAAASLGSTGDEAGEGTGGLAAGAAHLSGTGHEDFEGSGGIVGAPASLQGSEQPLNIGSGGIEGAPAALSGTGTVSVRKGGWGGFQRRERKRHHQVEPVPPPVQPRRVQPPIPAPKVVPVPAISGSGGISAAPAQLFGQGGLIERGVRTGRASLAAAMASLDGEGGTSVTVRVLEDRIAALESRLNARLDDAEALTILLM